MKVPVAEIRQENEVKAIPNEKEIKLALFADDMINLQKTPDTPLKTVLGTMSQYSKVVGYIYMTRYQDRVPHASNKLHKKYILNKNI